MDADRFLPRGSIDPFQPHAKKECGMAPVAFSSKRKRPYLRAYPKTASTACPAVETAATRRAKSPFGDLRLRQSAQADFVLFVAANSFAGRFWDRL